VDNHIDYIITRGRKIYEPPRFMTTMQCIDQLVGAEEIVKANSKLFE